MTDEQISSLPDLLDRLLRSADSLPEVLKGRLGEKLKSEVRDLINFIRGQRAPRFALIGRARCGKSTLLNAIAGAPLAETGPVRVQTGRATWRTVAAGGRAMEILDTRGFQEGGTPPQSDRALTPVVSILTAIDDKIPDVTLFLCKAKEVDAAVAGDLDLCEEVQKRANAPLVGVVTQCDELDPPMVKRLPTDDLEKNHNVNTAVEVLENHLNSRDLLRRSLVKVVPVSAWVRFRTDGSIDPNNDYRWNIEELVETLAAELPDDSQLAFARFARVKKLQAQIASRVVHSFATVTGLVGLEPVPFADLPVITSIQLAMIVAIAHIGGRDFSLDSAREFLTAAGLEIGGALTFRAVARGLIKLVPALGSLVSGAVATAGTEIIGDIAIRYFVYGQPLDEAKLAAQKSRRG